MSLLDRRPHDTKEEILKIKDNRTRKKSTLQLQLALRTDHGTCSREGSKWSTRTTGKSNEPDVEPTMAVVSSNNTKRKFQRPAMTPTQTPSSHERRKHCRRRRGAMKEEELSFCIHSH